MAEFLYTTQLTNSFCEDAVGFPVKKKWHNGPCTGVYMDFQSEFGDKVILARVAHYSQDLSDSLTCSDYFLENIFHLVHI